jgi:hypothetical protein
MYVSFVGDICSSIYAESSEFGSNTDGYANGVAYGFAD